MKFFYFATLFAVLFTLAQVQAKGYYCTKHIVIKHGDRCHQIYGWDDHKDYYIRYKDLMIINPTIDCDNLRTNQKICVDIDLDKSKSNTSATYTIKKGDTCASIAKKLKTPLYVLKNVNMNILLCDEIKGQVGVKIGYKKDGDYVPNFKNSKRVQI